ncbi:uncharacterized protein LOC144155086 isoform X2 [Haemaphysalis longicornis]
MLITMPKRFTGKLCAFLFRHLDLGTFGERLTWIDRDAGIFQLLWKHGNQSSATPEDDCVVFMEWHRFKTRGLKDCKPMDAKQRFRAALNKMKFGPRKTWENEAPPKGFQYRVFPKEDLDYLLKKQRGDQHVPDSPRSPACSDDTSDVDSDITDQQEPATPQQPAESSPGRWDEPLNDFLVKTQLGSEAPYRPLTSLEKCGETFDWYLCHDQEDSADLTEFSFFENHTLDPIFPDVTKFFDQDSCPALSNDSYESL